MAWMKKCEKVSIVGPKDISGMWCTIGEKNITKSGDKTGHERLGPHAKNVGCGLF